MVRGLPTSELGARCLQSNRLASLDGYERPSVTRGGGQGDVSSMQSESEQMWFHSACCREHGLGAEWGGGGGSWANSPLLSPCQSEVCRAQGWKAPFTQGRNMVGVFPLFSGSRPLSSALYHTAWCV